MWKKVAIGSAAVYAGYLALAERKQTLGPSPQGRKRCIFVTGAASGIGEKTVQYFIERGWFVGAYDINIEKLRSLYGSLGNDTVCFFRLDVTDGESCEECISHFMEKTNGCFDVLFNCAGLLVHAPFEDTPLEKLIAMVRVNIEGVIQLTHMALPSLKKTADSRVITMASLAAIGGIPREAVYSATKTFVYSWTESMRTEMHSQVRFADVSVSYVDTPMVRTQEQSQYTDAVKPELKNITADMVVQKVWQAVHECDFYNEHFYVNNCDRIFSLNHITRAFKIPFSAWYLKKMLWDK
mmetsp:Transcript_2549/g.2948  ORF Transcript_2549/g.2948 Transcript_2549/m.2948 type:complete len:296 (-) Transcript_2549:287-1174(-)